MNRKQFIQLTSQVAANTSTSYRAVSVDELLHSQCNGLFRARASTRLHAVPQCSMPISNATCLQDSFNDSSLRNLQMGSDLGWLNLKFDTLQQLGLSKPQPDIDAYNQIINSIFAFIIISGAHAGAFLAWRHVRVLRCVWHRRGWCRSCR